MARTTMKAPAKCDKHGNLQDSVKHQKFEWFFRVILEHIHIEFATPFSHLFFAVGDPCTDLDIVSSHSFSKDFHESKALNTEPDFR